MTVHFSEHNNSETDNYIVSSLDCIAPSSEPASHYTPPSDCFVTPPLLSCKVSGVAQPASQLVTTYLVSQQANVKGNRETTSTSMSAKRLGLNTAELAEQVKFSVPYSSVCVPSF